MGIKQHLRVRSTVLKDHVNKYAILGLGISFLSIIIATILVSYQITGFIDFPGVAIAQKTNPALWALDLTPFMFAYWGQSFCYEVVSTMESLIENKTKELRNKSTDLELKLQYETNHDHLTNLPNQRLLSQRISQGIKQIKAGEELAVILLHINGFKKINFKYGSFNANSVLVQFSEKLKTVLLEPYLLQAYMGMNMVARLQGAEFALLIPRLRKDHNLEELLSKILVSTTANFMIDGNSVNISTTAGVALYPLHGREDTSLIRHASLSLFNAEKDGVLYAIYHAGMDKNVTANQIKTKELSSAIDNEVIGIVYQPDVELKTEHIMGMEAQINYNDAKHGLMDTDKIIPLIEGTVLVKKLTAYVLEKSIKQLALWHQANHKIYLTVNLLDVTDKEIPLLVNTLLKEQHISPEYLKLEFTEAVCLSDQTLSSIVLNDLAALGVKLVVSDFCSGYSSFTYLTNFPISEIKIDKSFIMNMMTDEKKLSIVSAAIKLANAMNIDVFAGGIADQEMLGKLLELGCLYGQGAYLYSPVSQDRVSVLLNSNNMG